MLITLSVLYLKVRFLTFYVIFHLSVALKNELQVLFGNRQKQSRVE